MPGDRLQHDRTVLGGAGERSHVVEGARERDPPVGTAPTVGWLKTAEAAEGSRIANRATGVRPEGGRHLARGDGGGRAGAGTAGEAVQVPGVASWSVLWLVVVGRTV